MKSQKVALIADWLTSRGGAERVFQALCEMYPEADIFTSVYTPELFPELKERKVYTTWLQKLPEKLRKRHQFLLPFLSLAFGHLNLKKYDLILSSSSAFAKHVKTKKGKQVHVCYCHSPTRYLFHAEDDYVKNYPLPWWGILVKPFLPLLLGHLRKKDIQAAKRVDFFIANSNFIADRIKQFYNRESVTIYPCIDTKPFKEAAEKNHPKKDFFLAIGRFIPYKKFDLLVQTFRENGLPLKLAGTGPELKKCHDKAKGHDNIEFLGFVDEKDLAQLYTQAKAFLFPAEEDFGLTPIEAMSSGTPVIYYGRGGATESVSNWGIPFTPQTPEALQKALETFLKTEQKSKEELVKRGESFDKKFFQQNIRNYIQKVVE